MVEDSLVLAMEEEMVFVDQGLNKVVERCFFDELGDSVGLKERDNLVEAEVSMRVVGREASDEDRRVEMVSKGVAKVDRGSHGVGGRDVGGEVFDVVEACVVSVGSIDCLDFYIGGDVAWAAGMGGV